MRQHKDAYGIGVNDPEMCNKLMNDIAELLNGKNYHDTKIILASVIALIYHTDDFPSEIKQIESEINKFGKLILDLYLQIKLIKFKEKE